MSLAPEQKLTYPLAGPAGPAAFAGGMQGFEAQSFRGLGVFNSTPVRRQRPASVAAPARPRLPSPPALADARFVLCAARSTRSRTVRGAR